jgi:signal peptide peptidase SppA
MSYTTPMCFAHHMGLYMLETRFAENFRALIQAAPRYVDSEFVPGKLQQEMLQAEPISESRGLYGITSDGIGIIPIVGVMTKGGSKFGSSINDTRRAIAKAVNDPSVKAIMLHLDTPGGSFAGTDELANDVAKAAQVKPLAAHGDDLVASAGMYVASQAPRFTLNAAGEAGSIGTYAVVEDSSGAAEMAGVKVHLVTTGEMKGFATPGTEINAVQLERFQQMVNNAQGFFSAAIQRGRNMTAGQVNELVRDGSVYFAKDAKAKGLIDAVESYDVALDKLASRIKTPRANAAKRSLVILDKTS